MDDSDPYRPRRRGVLGPVLALLVAFAVGVALTGAAVRHWDRLAVLLHPASAPIAATAQPAFQPPVIQPTPAPVPVPDAVLVGRVGAIETRIADIDKRAAEARGDANRAEGLLVAFAARRALDRGQPLGFLEGMLRDHFGAVEPQAVAMVIGAAQRPATLVQLQERFAALAPVLDGPAPNEGWWAGLRREMGSLLVIRRGDVPSTLPSERQARAARALDQGQVDLALNEVARMPGSPGATDWVAGARRYVLARNALDRLETAALLRPAGAAVLRSD